jgi:hypothetical protein
LAINGSAARSEAVPNVRCVHSAALGCNVSDVRRRPAALLLLAFAVSACGAERSRDPAVSAPPLHWSLVDAASVAPDAAADAADARPIPTSTARVDPPPDQADPAPRKASKDDPDAWLESRGIAHPLGMISCEAVVEIGSPARQALRCTEIDDPLGLEDGRSLFLKVFYVAEGNKLRTVFEAPVSAGAMDAEGGDDKFVELDLVVSRGGTQIDLREHPGLGCADVARSRRELRAGGLPQRWLAQAARLTDMVCAARGTYRWQGRAFVRGGASAAAKTPAPKPPASKPSHSTFDM